MAGAHCLIICLLYFIAGPSSVKGVQAACPARELWNFLASTSYVLGEGEGMKIVGPSVDQTLGTTRWHFLHELAGIRTSDLEGPR